MHTTLIGIADMRIMRPRDVTVFDCRFDLADSDAGRKRFEAGHIPEAIYVHLDDDLSGPVEPGRTGRHPLPERAAFVEFLRRHGVTPERQVIAYDDAGGIFAARLWWMARWAGHPAAAVLDGGYATWLDGSETRHEVREPSITAPRAVSMQDVCEHSADGSWHLVDARAEDRFHGRNETIDPKAGHIPGAINAPFEANLGADGHFLPAATLHYRFASLFGAAGVATKPVACYCGSGVSAAHNVLAMVHAGLPEPALYAGSWSEWITDPGNPTAT